MSPTHIVPIIGVCWDPSTVQIESEDEGELKLEDGLGGEQEDMVKRAKKRNLPRHATGGGEILIDGSKPRQLW